MGDFSYPDIDWNTSTISSAESKTGFCPYYRRLLLHAARFYPIHGEAVLDLDVEVISELGSNDHNMVSFDIRFGCYYYYYY